MTCGLAPSGFSLLASLAIWLNPYCCRTASADNPALYRLNDRAVGLARFFSICCCESTSELETATSEAIAYPQKNAGGTTPGHPAFRHQIIGKFK
jgi:hypothetical protein